MGSQNVLHAIVVAVIPHTQKLNSKMFSIIQWKNEAKLCWYWFIVVFATSVATNSY